MKSIKLTKQAMTRIFNRHLSPHQLRMQAHNIKEQMPINGGPVSGGMWPKFEGHFFEELHANKFNQLNKSKDKVLELYNNGFQQNFDGMVWRNETPAEAVQIKLGTGSIKRAIENIEKAGKKAKKAKLVVPKDLYDEAVRLADGRMQVEASYFTRNQIREQARYAVMLTAKKSIHLSQAAKTMTSSVILGAAFDARKLIIKKMTVNEFVDERKRDVVISGATITLNYGVANIAVRFLGHAIVGKGAFVLAMNPWIASTIIIMLAKKAIDTMDTNVTPTIEEDSEPKKIANPIHDKSLRPLQAV